VAELVSARGGRAVSNFSTHHGVMRLFFHASSQVFAMHKFQTLPPISAIAGTSTTTGLNGDTRHRNSTRDGDGNGTTTIARANGEPATREVVRSVP
jgi:hypothetical protein